MDVITTPKVEIDEELLVQAKARTKEEKQIIIHVEIRANDFPFSIRIWPNTYLLPHEKTAAAKLLHAERISMAPPWTLVNQQNYNFTLIFQSLSKDCEVFDLLENIPTFDRFEYRSIARNKSDVYYLTLNS